MTTELPVQTDIQTSDAFGGAEVPQEQPKPQSEAEQFFSQKLAALQRREKEIRALEQRVKSEKPAEDPDFKRYTELKRRAKVDPMAWLQEAGLSYDEITEYQLNGGKPAIPEEVLTLQQKIEQMEKERAEEKQKFEEEGKSKAHQAQIAQIKNDILEKRADYELITALDKKGDQYEMVKSVMEEAAHQGQELSSHDAAMLVEKYLEKEILQFKGNAKIMRLLGALENKEEPIHNEARNIFETQSSTSHAGPKTLTNSMTQNNSVGQERELTEAEARAKAVALLRFND